MLMIILLSVLAAFFTLNTHELSHCAVVWLYKQKVTGYKPYPHYHEGKFYFARMTYSYEDMGEEKNNKFLKLFYLAPCLKATFLMVLFTILPLFFSLGWCYNLWTFFVMEILDSFNWGLGFWKNSDNDGGFYRRLKEK